MAKIGKELQVSIAHFFFSAILPAGSRGTLDAASANEALHQWSGYKVRTLTLRACKTVNVSTQRWLI